LWHISPYATPAFDDKSRAIFRFASIRRSFRMLRYNLVTENQRDAGLVRAVGTWGFTASIINIVIGAGIFAVPAALAACIGPYAPLAFLVCAVAVGSVALRPSLCRVPGQRGKKKNVLDESHWAPFKLAR
jgi:hypothetical protein